MGRVWVADQIVLERPVAIKLLSTEIIGSAVGRELFEREARATARVDHPHVVRVVDYALTNEGVPFLVLELLSGETLEERIQRSGPVALDDVRAILEQTSDALGFAHASGILHRDIKAENIFLQRRARPQTIDVKLLDFGVALHRARPMVHAMGIVGTPAYMASEQMTCAEVDERCDLFSLGVCVYYALTGELPYRGDTVEEVRRSLEAGELVPATKLRPELPPALDAWFSRAIATDREDRFASATEMFTAFERALEVQRDTPVSHARSLPSLTIPVERPSRRRSYAKRAAFVGAIAAAALVVAHAKLDHRRRAIARAEPAPVTTTIAAPRAEVQPPPPIASTTLFEAPPPAVIEPAAPTIRTEPKRSPKARTARDAGTVAAAIDAAAAAIDAGAPAEPDETAVIEGTEGFGNRQ